MKNMKQHAMRRQRLLRAARSEKGVQALCITNTPDIRYLSGCTEGAGALLVTGDAAALFVGKMFEHCAPKEAPDCEIVVMKLSVHDEVAAHLRGARVRKLGFQGNVLPWAQQQALAKTLGRRQLIDIGDAALCERALKNEQEITLIRKCVRIAEKAFLELIGQGAAHLAGRSEKEIAAELEFRMRMLGADRQGFPKNGIIVASGPNSASCHHVLTLRKAHRGEPVLFDWGAECDGYRSDITRVVFLGEPKPRFREIYEVVLEAHDAGVSAIRPGAACDRVSDTAWDVVRRAGHGDTIRHGLGHGLGLDVHEWPFFGKKPTDGQSILLRKNMVMTVEPGIYFEGFGGVRIEDDILVTARGHERLNKLPRAIDRMILR